MSFRLKVRNDASGYYAHAREKVMTEPFASLEEAEAVCGAMVNGAEFEVVEVSA